MTSFIDRTLGPVSVVAAFTALAWLASGTAMAVAMGAAVTLLLLMETRPGLDGKTRGSQIRGAGPLTYRPARS